MSTLERAIEIAAKAHAEKKDKAGAPYILHPIRVMLKLSSPEEQITAVLHDVIEDSDWSLNDIREEGFSETIVVALDSVTKRKGEAHNQFVLRAATNSIGRRVKLADLEDNCDLSRFATPNRQDQERVEKYQRSIELIRKC